MFRARPEPNTCARAASSPPSRASASSVVPFSPICAMPLPASSPCILTNSPFSLSCSTAYMPKATAAAKAGMGRSPLCSGLRAFPIRTKSGPVTFAFTKSRSAQVAKMPRGLLRRSGHSPGRHWRRPAALALYETLPRVRASSAADDLAVESLLAEILSFAARASQQETAVPRWASHYGHRPQ